MRFNSLSPIPPSAPQPLAENAILMKDAAKLALVAPGVKTELRYVTSGDGFYADGSYVQHDNLPYTGGYGMVTVLAGTDYAIQYDDGSEKVFFDAIFKSYEPFLYPYRTAPHSGQGGYLCRKA